MATPTTVAPAQTPTGVLLPNSATFAKDMYARLFYVPNTEGIDEKHMEGIVDETELLKVKCKRLSDELDRLGLPQTIIKESKLWEGDYKTSRRAPVLKCLRELRETKESLGVLRNTYTGLMHRRIEDYAAYMFTHIQEIANVTDQGILECNAVMEKFMKLRQNRAVVNLGVAAPLGIAHHVTHLEGRFHPPKDLVPQFNLEWKERIPLSERAYATATARSLPGIENSERKWCVPISSHVEQSPHRLWDNLPLVELVRKVYAPGTAPFSFVTSDFYQQQMNNPDWYDLPFLERAIADRTKAVAEAAHKDKAEQDAARQSALAEHIARLEKEAAVMKEKKSKSVKKSKEAAAK